MSVDDFIDPRDFAKSSRSSATAWFFQQRTSVSTAATRW